MEEIIVISQLKRSPDYLLLMIYFTSIKLALAKLVRDEIFYNLFRADLDSQCKAYCLLTGLKADENLIKNNFEYLKNEGFFENEQEENNFKNLPFETQVFYYLEFKKFKS